MKAIILSIKPQFSTQIFQGNKTVELRKSLGKSVTTGTKLFIYSSSPVQAIEGCAVIKNIEIFNVEAKQTIMTQAGCINADDYQKYYENRETGVGLWLEKIEKFERPVTLDTLKTVGFTPPQSFTYGNDTLWTLIETKLKN